MKRYMKLIPIIALGLSMGSCVDDAVLPYEVQKPESIAQYEYLNAYDVLKSYIDRSKYSNFKLGTGITANDFNKKGIAYELVTTNFDEMTAGNAMKYASCVSDDGVMNFTTVSDFVETAKAAGITIYGHTLAWHAQQNNKYLNGLIADKVIPVDPSTANHYLSMHQDEKQNHWDGQVYYTLPDGAALSQDTEYTLTFRAKASAPFSFQLWSMDKSNKDNTINGGTQIGTEWSSYSFKFNVSTADVNVIKFVVGELEGDFCVDDITLIAANSEENLIKNGDFEENNTFNWEKYSWHNITFAIATDTETGGNGGYCLKLTNETAKPNNYEAQAWYKLEEPLKSGVEYTFSCMVKATEAYNIAVFLQSTTVGEQGYLPSFSAETSWVKGSITFTPQKDIFDKFTLNFGDFAGTIFLDNVKLVESGSDENLMANSDFEAANIEGWASWGGYETLSAKGEGYSSGEQVEEMPAEEKKAKLTEAMENWIKGMMEACDGYVTAWDAVNEALSGGDKSGDGVYDLQSATRGTVSAEDAKNNFYWQDYLGDLDYVRTVVRLARKYFEETGGNPNDLKLFINDYNLESDWDDNGKMKSMLKWIERWEEDGITKIDGIGSQMHVSCYMNPQVQKGKEEHVVKMFELMASSGKLIKISELDMGVVDENGIDVKTEDVTFEQEQAMARYYKFIIQKYFEIIPVAQQYGITHWSPTDSPADSGWRAGSPIGLWTLDYNRKPAYAGFADGLADKKDEITKE